MAKKQRKTCNVNVIVTEEMNDEMVKTAKSMHISKSELVRRFVQDGLNANRSVETAYNSMTVKLEDKKETESWWKKLMRR